MKPELVSPSHSAIREALNRYRAVLLRGAVPTAFLTELAKRADRAYAEADAQPPISGRDRDLYSNGHISVSTLDDAFVNEVSASMKETIFDALTSFPVRSPDNVLLRRMLPPHETRSSVTKAITWHQDEYFSLASSPPGTPKPQLAFTAWVPMVDCGKDAPGLSVVLNSDEPIIFGKPRFGWLPYIIWRYGPQSIWSPIMNVGDVLLFTSRTIHGSNVRRNMTRTRYSLEFRASFSI